MALYANDCDVLEALLYRRLKTLWSACTDALAIFSKHRVGTELCGQKVWETLLSAFSLNHKRMQTVLLAREFSLLMAWDGHSKADVDRHFIDVSDTLEMLKFLARNIDITDVFKSVVLATLKSSKTKALTKAFAVILDNLDDAHDLTFTMIQQACVRKLRRSHARGVDRSQERSPAIIFFYLKKNYTVREYDTSQLSEEFQMFVSKGTTNHTHHTFFIAPPRAINWR